MICPNCGANLSDNVVFCTKCGTRVMTANNPDNYNNVIKKSNSKPLIFLLAAIIAVLAIIIVLLILNKTNKSEKVPEKEQSVIIEEQTDDDEKEVKLGNNALYDKETKVEESKDENMVLTMSESEKRDLNIFFSNFSEAFVTEYSSDVKDNYSLISFAFIHNGLNGVGGTFLNYSRMGITLEATNKTLDKYFGVSVPPENATNNYGNEWVYEDGVFWEPAASGESYDYFSIVTDMRDLGNGTYKAKYDVFYAGYDELSKECYSYTIEEANRKCEFKYSSVAVVKPKNYNGKNTYELISIHIK